MPIETTYAALQRKLEFCLDRVANESGVVLVRRGGNRSVVIITADELRRIAKAAQPKRVAKEAKRRIYTSRT